MYPTPAVGSDTCRLICFLQVCLGIRPQRWGWIASHRGCGQATEACSQMGPFGLRRVGNSPPASARPVGSLVRLVAPRAATPQRFRPSPLYVFCRTLCTWGRSPAGEKVADTAFSRKSQWFCQHLPLTSFSLWSRVWAGGVVRGLCGSLFDTSLFR